MTPGARLLIGFLFCLGTTVHRLEAGDVPVDPDKDPATRKLVEEARALADEKKPQPAIDKCEKVIALFKAYYGSRKEKIFCARTSAESLGYLLKVAADMNRGTFETGKRDAIVLSSTWSGAYFVKGYALQDLGRIAEAKATIKRAVELSPWNSLYLCELGSIYLLEKNWSKAREVFETAEGQAPVSPDESKASELGQARRGLGYVFVELGQLDEAEKKYEQCLTADPNDTKAAAELEYVRGLKVKKKSK